MVLNLTEDEIRTMEIVEEYIPKQAWDGKIKKRGSRYDAFASINGERNIDIEIQRLIRGDEEKRILYNFASLITDRKPGEKLIDNRDHIALWIFQSDISKYINALTGVKPLPYYTFKVKYEKENERIEGTEESFSLTKGDKIVLINGGYDWKLIDRELTDEENAIKSFILDMGEYEINNICDEVNREVMKEYMDEIYDSDLMMTMALEMDDASKAMLERRAKEAKAEGKIEGKSDAIKSLMKSMNFSFDKAANVLNIPESERESIRKYM